MESFAPSKRLPHLPALDGLRGMAVVAVLFFHAGFGWARGGYLGVSVFFTLSGFLITNLLVGEWADNGTISLSTFWSRRFRRLMPAAIATLLGVALYGWTFASPEQLQHLRGDLLAALAYVANWRFLFAKLSYADLFSAPSPVQHFWSLAIEEQFYVVYPLLVFVVLKLGGRRLLTGVLGFALLGSLAIALVERADLDRVYYGTDTRMSELIAGSLLALWWSSTPRAREAPRGWRRPGLFVLGAVGLLGSLALWPTVSQTSDWVTHGVLPLQAALSVCAIAAAARPGLIAQILGWTPLRAIGLVSYGLYLYHWPVFLVLNEERTDLGMTPLFVVRIAVTTVAALASYYLIEQPIRRRRVLLNRQSVRTAIVVGVTSVVVTAVAVTWSPPRTQIAHANVRLEDQKILVNRTGSGSSVGSGAPGAIMIIGDSGMFDAAPAIGAVFEHLGTQTVVDASFPGFGWSRNPPGWKSDYPKLIKQAEPGISVVMLGGWDIAYLHDKGRAAYDRLLDDAVEVLTARGGRVVWLGMMPDDKTETQTIDARFEALARRHPDTVAFTRIDAVLKGSDGRYPRWLEDPSGRTELIRKPDGWHLCPDGSVRVANLVARLAADRGWSPPPRSGWEQGGWRGHGRFNDPEGGCDESREENQPPND
jgi:peptidoglycan/LPS O-acetylase OafA/YrhL